MIEVNETDKASISEPLIRGVQGGVSRASRRATPELRSWRAGLVEELNQSPVRGRLAIGLAGVGCIHLATFAVCQSIFDPSVHSDLRHPALWMLELVAVLFFLRKTLGQGWFRSSSAINLVGKFWTTFLILSFNLVTLNSITGFELAWYKPVWGTLSTFFFASLAWLFNPWFLVPAVQMWATGLMMVELPSWAFLIYGVSWWIALTGIALWVRRLDQTSEAQGRQLQPVWREEASICDAA